MESITLSPQESVTLMQQMMTNNVLLMAVTVFLEPIFVMVWQRLPNGGWKADVFLPARLCGSNDIGTHCGESGHCLYDPVFAGNTAGDSCYLSGRCMVSLPVLYRRWAADGVLTHWDIAVYWFAADGGGHRILIISSSNFLLLEFRFIIDFYAVP